MLMLPLTLFLFAWSSLTNAGAVHEGQPCNLTNNTLQTGSFQFYTECDSQTYCSANGTCLKRGCRRDDFPFGYSQDSKGIPDKCPKGQFCPDEEDACQPLLAVGSSCQLNRDDECDAPPNFSELADNTNRGINFNGSVCLNNQCMWANVTAGQPCVIENTPYIGYGVGNAEFIDVVSRGNCRNELYCDSQTLQCVQTKNLNEACDGDKECQSYSCLPKGVCGPANDAPNRFPAWVYVVVFMGIVGGMSGTLYTMYFLHRRQRDREREKRIQYWREQNAFRQNILQMRDTANSILATPPSRRSTIYSQERAGSSDSQTSILQYAATKASGLRHYMQDDHSPVADSFIEPFPIERRPDGRF